MPRQKQASLTGGVSLTASNGYTLATETMTVSFAETRITAKDGVEVLTPHRHPDVRSIPR